MKDTPYTLYELNAIIRSAISDAFPETCWVIAEIAECKCNQRGHCYLDLVEKENDKTIAQMRAVVWAYEYRRLGQKFEGAAGESLKPGMRVMLLVAVSFHEVYGLSFNVKDIDPTYTLGEMARKKREVIERLKREGLIDLNRELPLPLVPQKIAVISSPTAAGYGDFFEHLDNNPHGFKFIHVLFPALMQGEEAERSVLSALSKIKRRGHHFDVVVITRGGGSATDLSCFDSYALASQVARFPLPVITGIGHEKDDTVVDMVAHTRMKTPTAVAEFLITGVRSFEERILEIQNRLLMYTERLLKDERHKLQGMAQKLAFMPLRTVTISQNRLVLLQRDLENRVKQLIQSEDGKLVNSEQAVRLLDPANVLRRGYSITHLNGKTVKDASLVKRGDVIKTRVHSGEITSIVEHVKEASESEQGQTDYLFSGTDRA